MEQNNKFDIIPNEMLLDIFSFFNKRDQGKASLVSKQFHSLSKHPSLNNLSYPDLDYGKILPAKSKSLITNPSSDRGISSIAVLSEKYFIIATIDGVLTVWDQDKAEPIRQFNKHVQYHFERIYQRIYKITPISSTKFISCGSHGTVYLWDIYQEDVKDKEARYWDEPLIEFKGHSSMDTVYEAAFLKESNVLITGGSDKTLRIWNIQTGECLHTLFGHTQIVSYLATFPNNLIVSASYNSGPGPNLNEHDYDLNIRLWNPNVKSTPLATLEGHTGRITAFCKLNNKLLATGSEDGTVRIWDIQERSCIKMIDLPGLKQPECLKLIAPGYLACGTLVGDIKEDCIYLYNIKDKNFSLVKSLTGHKHGLVGPNSLLDLKNGYFASADCIKGTIKLWHIEANECLQTLESLGGTQNLAKLPNGYLISGRFDKGGLNIWAFPEREFEPTPTPKP